MRNLLPDLLLAIEIFVHVYEVNSSPMYFGLGTSKPPPYVPGKDDNIIYIDFLSVRISVNRISIGDVHIAKTCSTEEGAVPGIPKKKNKKDVNFKTVPVFGTDGVRYCVAYVTEDNRLLGVQAPPTPHMSAIERYKGDPANLSPDSDKYYITYFGFDFVVHHHQGDPSKVTDVKLYPSDRDNNKYRNLQTINAFHIRVVKITFGDLFFFAARRFKKSQTAKPDFSNAYINFEAAWFDPWDIPAMLQERMAEEERYEWYTQRSSELHSMRGQAGHSNVPTDNFGESSSGQPPKKPRNKYY